MSTNDDMHIYTVEGEAPPSYFDKNLKEYYDDFFTNIIGFIEDIQTLSFIDSINKNNRLLYFGVILLLLSFVLIPTIY